MSLDRPLYRIGFQHFKSEAGHLGFEADFEKACLEQMAKLGWNTNPEPSGAQWVVAAQHVLDRIETDMSGLEKAIC